MKSNKFCQSNSKLLRQEVIAVQKLTQFSVECYEKNINQSRLLLSKQFEGKYKFSIIPNYRHQNK